MIKAVTLYARASSERQVRQAMRASQLAVLCARAVADEYVVLSGDEYVANGCVRNDAALPRARTVARSRRGRIRMSIQGGSSPLSWQGRGWHMTPIRVDGVAFICGMSYVWLCPPVPRSEVTPREETQETDGVADVIPSAVGRM